MRGSRVSDFFYFCGWGGEGGWVRWEGGRVRWGVKGGGGVSEIFFLCAWKGVGDEGGRVRDFFYFCGWGEGGGWVRWAGRGQSK